jgi:hypothetical protein
VDGTVLVELDYKREAVELKCLQDLKRLLWKQKRSNGREMASGNKEMDLQQKREKKIQCLQDLKRLICSKRKVKRIFRSHFT